ncbi:MAG: hypothetical protein SWO11_00460 [Thermodesulfobacteriota bacterium]|nr:hypothetical protein [Thermodesulfobacteriota bacterium]
MASDLNLLNNSDYERLANDFTEVKRMIAYFIKKLTADP